MISSSGIKRGLATTAVSALAVAGLPLLAGTAYADSVNDQVGDGNVNLYTQYSGVASTQFDGVNRTVHLLAGGGDDVSRVRFEYDNAAGATTVISTVSRTNGVFSDEWTPPSSLLGQSVTVRAVGLSSVDTPVAGATDENAVTVSADAAALDIANAPGSALGVFSQPYGVESEENGLPGSGVDHSTRQGVITGTTSGAGAITLRDLSSGSAPRPAVTPGAASNGVSSFRGTVNFQDYNLSGTPDEAIVGADQVNGSDDAEVVNLQSQTITNVTAEASPARVANGRTSTGVVTVTDAQNRPIAGAQVIFDRDNDGEWDGANNGGTEESRYTDANGQARFTGLTGTAGGTTYAFFVNTDGGDDYDPAIDFRRTVTVTSFAQVPTRITTSSADGDAFDVDENDGDDLQATVLDQNGQGVPNQTLNYTLSVVRFDGTTTGTTSVPGTATTDADGVADIPFVDLGDGTYTLRTYIEQNGTPGQQAGDLSGDDRTFKAGDADLEFAEEPTATSVAGTTDTYDATLALADGTPLPGRAVRFTYSATGNVVVAAQGNQPSGTTRNSDNQATSTTNAQGVASVALSDPATPDQAELDGQLNAETIANSIGDADAAADPLEVDFVDGTPPARSTITVFQVDEGKPGEATPGSLRVVADNDNNPATPATPVEGLAVTLDIDQNAFFTDGTAAQGAVVGEDFRLQNLGKTITVVTDANGEAEFQTTIERDSGFDDDGLVTATITARSGSVTDSEDQVFDSSNPINGGEVIVEQSPDDVQDNPVDPTRVGDYVYFDVTTTDQFGNVVGGEDYTATTDDDDNYFVQYESSSDFEDDGDFAVYGYEAGNVTVDVEWTTGTTVFVADPFGTEPIAGSGNNETLEDSAETEFYEIDFAASDYQITSSPEGTLKPGTAVTETVRVVDQEGRPVEGLNVQFIRSGPGEQDGDTNANRTTNANGEAFYNFVGTEEGTAQISAVVSEDEGTQPLRTLTDDVVFDDGDTPPPPPTEITVALQGANNGAKADKLKAVTTPAAEAAGARVRLFTRNANGNRVLLTQKVLNQNGAASFSERDRNGNRATTYWVVVSKTDTTTGARSADKKVR